MTLSVQMSRFTFLFNPVSLFPVKQRITKSQNSHSPTTPENNQICYSIITNHKTTNQTQNHEENLLCKWQGMPNFTCLMLCNVFTTGLLFLGTIRFMLQRNYPYRICLCLSLFPQTICDKIPSKKITSFKTTVVITDAPIDQLEIWMGPF